MSEKNKKEQFIHYFSSVFNYVKKLIKDPIFGVAAAISLLMWLSTKINEEYTSVITVPVEIVGAISSMDNSSASEKIDEDRTYIYDVDCRISGRGYDIILYLLFGEVKLNASDLPIEKRSGVYLLETRQMEELIAQQMNRVRLLNLYNKTITFSTISHVSKEVAVKPSVALTGDGDFMPIGDVEIEPKKVKISGDIKYLDEINEVYTEKINVTYRNKYISGEVALKPIEHVEFEEKSVYYSMNFQRYTEVKIKKKIMVKNDDNGTDYKIIPDSVEVTYNVAENIYSEFIHDKFPVYVDPNSKRDSSSNSTYLGDNRFIVQHSYLPKGVRVQSTVPVSVTVLRH